MSNSYVSGFINYFRKSTRSVITDVVLPDLPGCTVSLLHADKPFPLVFRPIDAKLNVAQWTGQHRDAIDKLICEHGALLFRGFPIETADKFESFVNAACLAEWTETREGSTSRARVNDNVFSATIYEPSLRLYVHNENSYVTSWPLYIFFHCRIPAAEGGYTPIADSRAVYRRLPQSIIARFAEKGWLYRRNFRRGSTVTWEKAFGTNSREDVERYCKQNYIIPEWTDDGLTVTYRRWAALRHPRTNQMVWFNHGTVFHPYTQEPFIKNMLRGLKDHELPYSTYYGDGSPIETEVMQILDEAYTAETISFPWEAGDVLMLDNMSIAHGRTPYSGRREVLIAMKWKISCSDVAESRQYALPTPSVLSKVVSD